jgi:hypothetical protein
MSFCKTMEMAMGLYDDDSGGELLQMEFDGLHLTVWARTRSGQVIRYRWLVKPPPQSDSF